MKREATLCLLLIMFAWMPGFAAETEAAEVDSQRPPDKPNILFIFADDMRADDLQHTPKIRELIGERGTTFNNAFVTDSLCCPSRATILTGRYAHNHKTVNNVGPKGGAQRFRELRLDRSTLATTLQNEGYETALVGKYMNDYRDETYIPPGWDHWYTHLGEPWPEEETYRIKDNEEEKTYRHDEQNLTELFGAEAERYVGEAKEPFFLHLSPRPPHAITPPTAESAEMFIGETLPRGGSYNEIHVGDKPSFIKARGRFTLAQHKAINERHRQRLGALRDLDDLVAGVVGELERTGKLDDTYIVFTSDNGYHMGEHRLMPMKTTAYEEDIRIPLLVSGPGVPEQEKEAFALNNDLAPTMAKMAGAEMNRSRTDGRSLLPLIEGTQRSWRTAFAIEKYSGHVFPQKYQAIRTPSYSYVRYSDGQRELYNVRRDPDQMNNFYGSAGAGVKRALNDRLNRLADCEAESCVRAENGP